MIYLSGHGAVTAGQEMFYFVHFDGQARRIQEISLDTAMLAESMRKLPALVLIIDACESVEPWTRSQRLRKLRHVPSDDGSAASAGKRRTRSGGRLSFDCGRPAPFLIAAVQSRSKQSSLAARLLAGFQRGSPRNDRRVITCRFRSTRVVLRFGRHAFSFLKAKISLRR